MTDNFNLERTLCKDHLDVFHPNKYSRYLPMPDYDKSDNDTVVLTLPGTVIDENYSLLLLENSDIDLATTVLLDKVQKGKSIGDEAIKMLRKKGLIEGRKPHLYVSKLIAKATNTQVEYTLKKGSTTQNVRNGL